MVICHPGKTHIHRSRGDTSWSAQTLPHETLPRNGRVTRSFYCDTSHFTGKVFFRHRGHRTGVHPPRNLNLGQNTPTTRFPRNPERATSMSIPLGVRRVLYRLGTNYETASAAQSGFGIRLAAADWVSNRSVQRPNWTNAGAAPLHRRPPAAVPAPRLVPVHENALWASRRGCSLVVPVRVPVGVRGFWVTCEGPLSAPDAHAPAGGAHNGHQ